MLRILIGFTILFFISGCSRHPGGKQFSDLRTQPHVFMPTVQDRIITDEDLAAFNLMQSLGVEASQQAQGVWIPNSAEIFRLAENSFMLGQNRENPDYKTHLSVGDKILHNFYSQKENATQFDSQNTLYLHAALGYEGEKIYNMLKGIGSVEDTKKLEFIFSTPCLPNQESDFCHSLKWPSLAPTLVPREFIASIISYLKRTIEIMEEQGISKDFVAAAKNQIQTEYLDKLSYAIGLLQNVQPDQPLIQNTNSLVEAVEFMNFLPAHIHQKLKTDLTKGNEYAETLIGKRSFEKLETPEPQEPPSVEKPKTQDEKTAVKKLEQHGYRLLNVISNIWLDLNSLEDRKNYIGTANEVLYDYLSDQSEAFILWMSGRISLDQYSDMCNGWLGCRQEYFAASWWRSKYVEALSKSCHGDIKESLDKWLSDKKFRDELREKNPELFKIFTSYQDATLKSTVLSNYVYKFEEIEADGEKTIKIKKQEFTIPYTSGRALMQEFTAKIAPLCMESVQAKIETALNNYILTSLDIEIRKYAPDIESVVADKITSNQKEISEGVLTVENFRAYFEKKAFPEMEKMIFMGQSLPVIENSKVQMSLDGESWKTRRSDPNIFETGAEVAGLSLAANYHKIISMPEIEGIQPDTSEYYSAVFSQINKMLAMVGFVRMDKTRQHALYRRLDGPIPELDIYKYDCSPQKMISQDRKRQMFVETKSADDFVDWREHCQGYEASGSSYFAFPDRLAIKNIYEPDDSVFMNPTSSAIGQSEIIRGGSLMLQYFKDWGTAESDFDKGMGKLLFSGVSVFPKPAFVNLGVAVSTIPIRSLKKPISGLYLFNIEGQELVDWQSQGIPSQDSPNPVTVAAFADILENGPSRIIKAKDLARMIMAIDEFLKATDGIEKTKGTVVNPPNKTIKENLNSIVEGRRLLKLMVAGVSNFMISRFQAEDGGYWSEYDLDSKIEGASRVGRVIHQDQPRSLEDQVYIIEALLKAHDIWNGSGSLISALEAYNYMNRSLFNSATGVYNSAEGVSLSLKPHVYLQTLIVLNRVKDLHMSEESRAQAEKLYYFYEKAWLNWIIHQKI